MRSKIIFGVLAAFGVMVTTIASDLSGYRKLFFHWIGMCCLVAGVFAIWHELTPEIETERKLRRVWLCWFFPSCLITFAISCLVWWPQKPEPTPKPELSFSVFEGWGKKEIFLTNDFLFLGKLISSNTNEYSLAVLRLPLKANTTAQLNLFVSNLSSNVPAELVQITAITPDGLLCGQTDVGDLQWKKSFSPNISNLAFATLELPTIGANRGRGLPDLTFLNAKEFEHRFLMFKMEIEAKNAAKRFAVFWLWFSSTNDVVELIPPPEARK